MSRFVSITTSDETERSNFFSKDIHLSYIYAAASTSRKGHHLWLSDAFAGGFAFLHFTQKDNHMAQVTRTTHLVKWKQIENFPNYFISNAGIVRKGGIILNPRVRSSKYRKRYYYIIADNKALNLHHRLDIHRLVWDYFGDEPFKDGYQIHHVDLNPSNNHISNLKLIPFAIHKQIHKILQSNTDEDITAVLKSGSFFLPDLLALVNSANTNKECCDNLLNALRDNQKQRD